MTNFIFLFGHALCYVGSVSRPGIESPPPALGAQSLNRWTPGSPNITNSKSPPPLTDQLYDPDSYIFLFLVFTAFPQQLCTLVISI